MIAGTSAQPKPPDDVEVDQSSEGGQAEHSQGGGLEHHVRIFDMMPVELYLTPFVAADSAPSKRLPRGHVLR